MRKLLCVSLACAVMVCFFALPGLNAADAPADGMKMDNYQPAKKNLVVIFNHSTHKTSECKECHHKWDGKGKVAGCSSAGCHDVYDKKDKTEKSYYKIIHKKCALSTCVTCHKDHAGADKAKKKELAGCKKSKCHP